MSDNNGFGMSSAAEYDEDELPPGHARHLPTPAAPNAAAPPAGTRSAAAPTAAAPPTAAPETAPAYLPVSGPAPAPGPTQISASAPAPGPTHTQNPAHAPVPAPAPAWGHGTVPYTGPAPTHTGPAPAPAPMPDSTAAPTPAPAPLPDGVSMAAPAPLPQQSSTGPIGPTGASANPYTNPYAGQYQPTPSGAPGGRGPDAQRPPLLRLVGRSSRSSGPEQQRLARLQTPVPRAYRISVTSIKGGVGKTTTSAMLGLTFARYRADRTVVMDANPHAGTLADRLLGERIMPTVRDLVTAELRRREQDGQGLADPMHIHQYLGQADRLMVAASEQSPDISELFDEAQYRTAQDVLTRAFDIVITDSGTGMKHSAMRGTLATTDRLVVVAAPRYDAARRAAKTLDEVYAQGYPQLVRNAVVVITMDAPKAVGINMNTLVDYFQQLCTTVVRIPYDQQLYAGGTIDYDRVSPATRGAYMDLAALLADGFPNLLPGN